MFGQTEPRNIAIDPDERLSTANEPPPMRFLVRELETSDGTNNLLALFDGSQQNLARRIAALAARKPY
jgi:hypothetical protein